VLVLDFFLCVAVGTVWNLPLLPWQLRSEINRSVQIIALCFCGRPGLKRQLPGQVQPGLVKSWFHPDAEDVQAKSMTCSPFKNFFQSFHKKGKRMMARMTIITSKEASNKTIKSSPPWKTDVKAIFDRRINKSN
jgi:hypothetical protein